MTKYWIALLGGLVLSACSGGSDPDPFLAADLERYFGNTDWPEHLSMVDANGITDEVSYSTDGEREFSYKTVLNNVDFSISVKASRAGGFIEADCNGEHVGFSYDLGDMHAKNYRLRVTDTEMVFDATKSGCACGFLRLDISRKDGLKKISIADRGTFKVKKAE